MRFDFERTTRAGRQINPAVTLYNYWWSVLEPVLWPIKDTTYYHRDDTWKNSERPHGTLSFDDSYLGVVSPLNYGQGQPIELGPDERPNLYFGGQHAFQLNHKGEFRLGGHSRSGRSKLSKHTFLDSGRFRGEYVWWCSFNLSDSCAYWMPNNLLTEPKSPVVYIGESALFDGRHPSPWLKLVHNDGHGWHLTYSRQYDGQGDYAKRLANYEAFRIRRYRRIRKDQKRAALVARYHLEGRDLLDLNLRPDVRANKEARLEAGLQAIVASLDAKAPARTTPLRRHREEDVPLWELSGSL